MTRRLPPSARSEAGIRSGFPAPRLLRLVGLVVVVGAAADARAERWYLDPSVATRATWTNNAGFGADGQRESDVILEATPQIVLRGEGKRFNLSGSLGLTALTYAGGSRDNRYLPSADLSAKLEAIEQFFFIDAGVSSRQAAESAFAPNPNSAADVNTVTSSQYRIAPYFEGRVGSDVRWRLRSANSWSDVSGNGLNAGGAYLGEHSLRIERTPSRFGWTIEAARSDTRFETGDVPSAVVDSARLILVYALTPEFNLGVRSGYERTNIVIENDTQVIYGGQFAWKPSNRTDLNGYWEKRFFGSGWQLAFNHRMPRVAWNAALSRNVQTAPQLFLTLPATNDLAALLDSAFATRFPDPTERARAVSDLMARQGLSNSLSAETRIFANRISLVTTASLSMVVTGVRNTFGVALFHTKSEEIQDSAVAASGIAQPNLTQQGVSVTFSHQFSSVTSLNVGGLYSRPKGSGPQTGLTSTQKSASAQLTRQLAPKTNAFAGLRTQTFDSNVPGVASNARENAGFVGLNHRF